MLILLVQADAELPLFIFTGINEDNKVSAIEAAVF
jgi:hypothetical protein